MVCCDDGAFKVSAHGGFLFAVLVGLIGQIDRLY